MDIKGAAIGQKKEQLIMKISARHAGLVLILGAALVATTASAQVDLYDFPWAQDPGAWESGNYNGIGPLAQTFTTGDDALTLDSVEIWIRNSRYPSDDESYAGTLSVDLYATDSGNGYRPTGSSLYSIVADQSIGTWYDNGPGAGNGTDYTGLDYALAANTTYAIVFAPSGSDTIGWKYPSSGSPSSDISPTPTFYNWEWDGDSWEDGDPETAFSMKVVADAVPEPTTGLLIALGGCLLAACRLRRNRQGV